MGSRVANDLAPYNEGTALAVDGCSRARRVVAECAEFAVLGFPAQVSVEGQSLPAFAVVGLLHR